MGRLLPFSLSFEFPEEGGCAGEYDGVGTIVYVTVVFFFGRMVCHYARTPGPRFRIGSGLGLGFGLMARLKKVVQ